MDRREAGRLITTNLQSLLNTLASLRAVRWVGATTPAHGFDKPLLVLTFTTSPDDKALHKLTVGNRTDEQMWFAKVDGRDGTFVISKPDLNALRLPIAKAATPAVNSSPTPASSRIFCLRVRRSRVVSSPVASPSPPLTTRSRPSRSRRKAALPSLRRSRSASSISHIAFPLGKFSIDSPRYW